MICQGFRRAGLVHMPTPLEAADRLSRDLGIDLWIKREDLSGLAVGGNKARLLDFVIGELLGQGVDTIIAHAAAQSNKLRDMAAAAARCGMRAVLIIPDDGGLPPQGNRLLFDLLGADVRIVPATLDRGAIIAGQETVREEMLREGRRPAVLDKDLTYGVDATIAYVDAAEELAGQFDAIGGEPQAIYIAAGAGMTAAGLALGLKHLGSRARVVGVSIASPADEVSVAMLRHAAHAAERLGLSTRLDEADFDVADEALAPGYGVLTPDLVDIIGRVARLHGLVLDPVYNAKVALTLASHVASGRLPQGVRTVFVNTGGSPAIYQYSAGLAGSLE